jgi:methylenetetrahydrofolate reductase (NADPH)
MSQFREKLRGRDDFVVTVEFVPGRGPKGRGIEEVVDFATSVLETGLAVDAVSTTCNPGGNPAISPDVLGRELLSVGVEPLIHFACTNLNRNMMEARANALSRDGIENLIVVTGDYPMSGYGGVARPVFDLDCVQAVHYLKDMNRGLEIPGRKHGTTELLAKTDFFVGCAVSPFKRLESEMMPQLYKLEKKVRAGADFIVTQVGYDVRKFAELRKYMRLRNIDVPVLGNVYTLNRSVAWLMNQSKIHGCVVTDELLAKIEAETRADDKGKGARLERSAQLTAIFRGLKFNGVHIGGFGLKCQDVADILQRADEIGESWRDYLPNFQYHQGDEFYLFPEDPELNMDADEMVPVAAPGQRHKPLDFQVSRLMHRLVFEEHTRGFKMMTGLYRFLEDRKRLNKSAYFFERHIKRTMFDCRECGDCALVDLAYVCPMAKCPKFQRNGPCGGSQDGWCEVDSEKPCLWTRVYDRLASVDQLDTIRDEYVPPIDNALADTSSWANFYLGRDHTGKKRKEAVALGKG